MSYEIKLPLFEGPFDLLLFFIERDELDIYDIPISEITANFLTYITELEKLNIEVASEFILVAATLIRIKSKLLLPREKIDEKGNELDPRDDLVKHLIEYKKYKSVIGILATLEENRLSRKKRGNVLEEFKAIAESSDLESELQDVNLYKLFNIYERVLMRFKETDNTTTYTVVPYKYTISDTKEKLLTMLTNKNTISFNDIMLKNTSKIAVVFTFLAILELLQMQLISIKLGEGYNNFWLKKNSLTKEKKLA